MPQFQPKRNLWKFRKRFERERKRIVLQSQLEPNVKFSSEAQASKPHYTRWALPTALLAQYPMNFELRLQILFSSKIKWNFCTSRVYIFLTSSVAQVNSFRVLIEFLCQVNKLFNFFQLYYERVVVTTLRHCFVLKLQLVQNFIFLVLFCTYNQFKGFFKLRHGTIQIICDTLGEGLTKCHMNFYNIDCILYR